MRHAALTLWLPLFVAATLAHAQPQSHPKAPAQPDLRTQPALAPAPALAVAPPVAPVTPPLPPLSAGPGRLYAPGDFDRVELAGAARVVLVQGEHDRAFIAGDAEVQKTVEVELHNRQLVIRPTGGWKFWHNKQLFVQVEVRQLRQLSVSGASDVHVPGPLTTDRLNLSISGAGTARLDQLQARQLSFVISGAGDGELGGRVDDLALQISGKGKVIAERLKAQRARVNVSGIGNVTVWVTDDLVARISGVGSVDYFGSPNVLRSMSGMGSITPRGDKRP